MTHALPRVCLVLLCVLVVSRVANGDETMRYVDARDLSIGGRGFADTESFFNRLPAAAKGVVRDAVWELSEDSAGIYVRFDTNAPQVSVRYTLTRDDMSMWHFPSTGVCGVDIYAFDTESRVWRWVATSDPKYPITEMVADVSNVTGNGQHTALFKVHLPTYNSVSLVEIGVPDSKEILLRSDPTFKPTSPVVWYGTSILQGGVASRPGQAFTNIISRGINQEILNFGFSGNGMMELSVAKFLTALPAAAFLIDCNWNMNGSLVAERVEPLVQYLRANGHPDTPILLVEGTNAGASWFNTGVNASRQALRNALRKGYTDLVSKDKNLIYVEGDQFYNNAADNYTDPTVGGTHPSDLGMAAVANVYKKLLPPILAASATAGKPFSPINFTAWAQAQQASAEAGSHGADAAMLAQHGASDEHRRAASLSADLKPAQPTAAQAWKGDEPVAFRDLMVGGRAFNATPSNLYYSRLPQAAEGVVRDAVWNLSLMSTGMYIRFVTNSSAAAFTWALTAEGKPLWHMPNSGVSGLDLFAFDVTKQRWRHVGVPTTYDYTNTWSVSLLEQGADVTYLLYLPLRNSIYNGTLSVNTGTFLGAGGCARDTAPPLKRPPIVWYGTSIQQGGVASRPGHEYDAFLSRELGREIFNFGFAGNGVEELSVAQFITTLDAHLFVIDCLPNMDAAEVANRTIPLVQYLRQRHPSTPIVLAEGTPSAPYHLFASGGEDLLEKNAALKACYNKLVKDGDEHLYYVESKDILPDPFVNPTVAGVHPSDLGQHAVAMFYSEYLSQFE